jgi:Ca2+-binding EF-hand superfamily protein
MEFTMSQKLQLILALSLSCIIIAAVLFWQIAMPSAQHKDLAFNQTPTNMPTTLSRQTLRLSDAQGLEAEAGGLQEAQNAEGAARRFKRTDKDKDGQIAQSEYLLSRRKAFDKLDQNGDGRLTFEEYASRSIARFQLADADKNGALNAREYATTAARRTKNATAELADQPFTPNPQ